MLIAFDIGNTHTVIGIFDGDKLVHNFRLESERDRTVDEFALQISGLLKLKDINFSSVSKAIICCVVPALTRVFSKLCVKYFNVTPLIVNDNLKLDIEIKVDDPSTVGADRLVNVYACREIYGYPVVVVDLGTATTFDVLDNSGAYCGGAISPGMMISAQALFDRAAMLPNIELFSPSKSVGKNTKDAMLSGIVLGYVGLVDSMVKRLFAELNITGKVIATGGIARLVSQQSATITDLVPDLTLDGLRIIASKY